MKMRKILAGLLAVMMTMTAVSFTIASAEESPNELVISYTKIQKGNVDRKEKSVIDGAYSDPEKGTVVKVTARPETTEKGQIMVDGYGIGNLNIDVTKYNFVFFLCFTSSIYFFWCAKTWIC